MYCTEVNTVCKRMRATHTDNNVAHFLSLLAIRYAVVARQQQVGRINLREFDHIQNAIQRINVSGPGGAKFPLGVLPKAPPSGLLSGHAGAGSGIEDHHYAPLIPQQPKKRLPRSAKDKGTYPLVVTCCIAYLFL